MVYKGNKKREIEYNLCYCRPVFYDCDSCSGCKYDMKCYENFQKDLMNFENKSID